MSPIPSGADRALQALLADHGIEATAMQLIGWRQAGLLRKDGSGYPPEIVERARAAQRLVEANPRKLHVAVLAMFAEGEFSIATDKLRAVYLAGLDDLERDLQRTARTNDPAEIPFESAEALAKRFARDPRFAARRSRILAAGRSQKREPRGSILASICANLASAMLTGEATSDQAIQETLDFLGAPSLSAEMFPDEAPPDAETLGSWISEMLCMIELRSLRNLVVELTAEQLGRYRDDVIALNDWAKRRPEPRSVLASLRVENPAQIALASLGMCLLERDAPDVYKPVLAALREANNADQT